jgi:hypothetical protein
MDASNANAAPTDAPSARSKSVTDVYLNLLAEEGYRPRSHPRSNGELVGLVTFSARGAHFILFACEDDPGYFRLGCEYELGAAPHELPLYVGAANVVNEAAKGVKVVLAPEEDAVRFTVETFLTGNATPHLLDRSISALLNAATSFFTERRPPKHLDA